ncbi:hypothetical protein AAFF_G00137910 [Aldrovandia affinis]|uniref:Uncharacterized protein n=1 Tax=Aldrovandia affinis TaxID=143900 RepID=A0AAD7TBU0_9TELE|nr:hypothetical protein AAFF_G00137910 [Aldrovandia affinis]
MTRIISKNPPPQDFNTNSTWTHEWESLDTPNNLITNPTLQPPGFNLPRQECSTLNRFRTGHSPCLANLHRWGIDASPLCACGMDQTMHHIIEEGPIYRFSGGLETLHTEDQKQLLVLGTK